MGWLALFPCKNVRAALLKEAKGPLRPTSCISQEAHQGARKLIKYLLPVAIPLRLAF